VFVIDLAAMTTFISLSFIPWCLIPSHVVRFYSFLCLYATSLCGFVLNTTLLFSEQARGLKKHLKRLNAPKHWMLDKLGGAFVS
jgi:hypothetical protein